MCYGWELFFFYIDNAKMGFLLPGVYAGIIYNIIIVLNVIKILKYII